MLIPAQVIALISTGLVIGQHSPASSRLALPAFALALVAALFAPIATVPSVPLEVLLLVAVVAGALVAASLDTGSYGSTVLAVLFGVLIGLAANDDARAENLPWTSLAGTAAGAVIFVTVLAGVCTVLRKPWQKTGVRIVGSWVAACALLVFSLMFSR